MSLRLRLALISSLVTFLALILLGVLSGFALERAMLEDMDNELLEQARVVLQEVLDHGELSSAAEDALTTLSGSSATWVYRDGKLLVGAGNVDAPEPLDPGFIRGFLPQAHETVADWRVTSLRTDRIVVQVGRPNAVIRRTLENYARNAAVVGFVSALLAGVLIAVFVARSTRPLALLAERVRDPLPGIPMPGTESRDEIGSLARALEQSRITLQVIRERETRFLADAAHELRTPVTAMLVELDHHLSRPRSQRSDHDILERSRKHARHLRDLSNNLLALTRAGHEIGHVQLDLFELVSDVVDRLAPLAAARQLEISLDGTPVTLEGDPLLLARAVENLIGNAIKFTDHGEVRVRVGPDHQDDQYAQLEVADTGVGIPAQTLERVFEPFHRSSDTRIEGSGLGLSVVQAVIEAHGGRLELHSQPGQGTRALIWLPRDHKAGHNARA